MKSPAQTMRIFQKDWGDTPYNYLQKLRCSYACRYLNNTEHSIKELASLLGFKDEFYFSNWFKKQMGCAPSFYRQNHQS